MISAKISRPLRFPRQIEHTGEKAVLSTEHAAVAISRRAVYVGGGFDVAEELELERLSQGLRERDGGKGEQSDERAIDIATAATISM